MEHAYWKQMIEIEENGIFLVFGITRNDQINFYTFLPFHRQRICPYRNAGRRMNAG